MARSPETPGTTDVNSPSTAAAAAPSAVEFLGAAKLPDVEKMATEVAGLASTLAAAPAPAAAQASPAEIDDELAKGGPAIGSFLKAVGLAVAETQAALDATLVKTAQDLSNTNIRTIAVFEQNLDDNGNMTKGNPIIQELPLINFLMPTAYAFSQVHLSADMEVSEFNAAHGMNIKKSSLSASAKAKVGYGLGSGWGGSASMKVDASTSSTNANQSQSEDKAAGKLHMEATLEPRTDVQLPRPFIIQRGPRLQLMLTEVKDITAPAQGTDPAKVIGREATIQALLTNDAGQPLDGKTLQVSCDQPTLNYTASGTTGGGSGNGKATITVSRQGPNYDPKASITGNIRVWMNLVTATTPVTL